MNRAECDIVEESVTISSPAGQLSAVLAYPLAGRPALAALIVGPHPLMGGKLSNNVVRHVGRGLAECGLATLRFAFAGGDVSAAVMDEFWHTGRAPEDAGRSEEVRAAWRWLAGSFELPSVVVGYSFGASLLGALLSEGLVRGAAFIGATFTQHDYAAAAASRLPKLVLCADNDFATPLERTQAWFDAACEPKTLVILPAAEHFYRGQEQRLVAEIAAWLPK